MLVPEAAVVLLYVEDQLLIQEGVVFALREAGYEVLVADSSEQALQRLDASSGSIRGLITDVDLGGGPTGWDVARRARTLTPDLPVVYVTGKTENEWKSKGVPYSVVIGKPFVTTQVVIAISQLLNATDL